MANKCIDQIVYSFKRPGKNACITSIELIYNPHGHAIQWKSLKLTGFTLEPISIEQVKHIFKTCQLDKHIEVQLKDNFGGEVYCYNKGQLVSID
jgi:hypothetical protein